ncbi:MAG: hypothetical protein ACK4FJ_10795 [Ferrovibrio sp.]
MLVCARSCRSFAQETHGAVITAWSNDYDYASLFARQVEAYGRAGIY